MIERATFQELWDNDHQRRDAVKDLLCIYDHDWSVMLQDKIRENFAPQNQKRMFSKLDTSLNLLRWSSDTLAPIYCEGVKRSIEGDETADLSVYEADGLLNLTLDRASRLLFAVRELVLRPIVNEVTGQIMVDIITPDQCSVIRHPDNPLRLTGLVYQTQAGDFIVWTEDDHKVFDAGWVEKRKPDGEPYVNDYGIIPFVLAHAVFPDRGTWHEKDANGLKAATLNLGMAKTDYNHKRHLQSHKQMVFTGVGNQSGVGKKAASDPSYAILLKDQGASASVLDLQGNLGEHLNSIINDAAQTLSLYGINPGAVKGSLDASSGYALSIKLTDTERVWKQQRTLWEAWERQLVRSLASRGRSRWTGHTPGGTSRLHLALHRTPAGQERGRRILVEAPRCGSDLGPGGEAQPLPRITGAARRVDDRGGDVHSSDITNRSSGHSVADCNR